MKNLKNLKTFEQFNASLNAESSTVSGLKKMIADHLHDNCHKAKWSGDEKNWNLDLECTKAKVKVNYKRKDATAPEHSGEYKITLGGSIDKDVDKKEVEQRMLTMLTDRAGTFAELSAAHERGEI